MFNPADPRPARFGFSALQRAEIAEIETAVRWAILDGKVSVLFNEPKLLKSSVSLSTQPKRGGFSALQRAEIAEIVYERVLPQIFEPGFSALQRAEIAEIDRTRSAAAAGGAFQCSSTSRNC